MVFKDKSPRTTASLRSVRQVILASTLLITGVGSTVYGSYAYSQMVKGSSTPIGKVLGFARSEAEITISSIYTDKTNSALVVRFSVPPTSSKLLPFKGTDYNIYLVSNALENQINQEVDVLFGRMSTDGDMFLVIPKPKSDVYSVAIMNTKFLNATAASKSAKDVSKNVSDVQLSEQSITKAISGYKYDPKNNSDNVITVADNFTDVVAFRVTTHPSLDNDKYKPQVLDNVLLVDDNGKFNFNAMFDKIFKESAISSLKQDYDKAEDEKKFYKDAKKEAEERLEVNSRDEDAKATIKEMTENLASLDSKQQSLLAKISTYESLTYDDKYFQNLQSKAKVLSGFAREI